ncbi:hypothetical protein HYT55_02790 [Candidatus Woesearchaeota archaeon]|nr:hypothetical protein [Candidatus Woesearchaeota archaeon]
MIDFAAHGFQTGRVILPGLELAVDLAPNQWFRYDGNKLNPKRYQQKLERELDLDLNFEWGDNFWKAILFGGSVQGGGTYRIKVHGETPTS